ncbi:phosphotransferase enzyme family protein [Cerasicoccus fimbriatus]|uniref:phosphotransferase enzyme family protein n=1 Tax=Cerasicoccus fimbriatus TaxID=3014554 RepID=UPI0022B45B67|nr:aminoglycoside phosphotransferase family protein [Cerasicoccus sp. TK19100]
MSNQTSTDLSAIAKLFNMRADYVLSHPYGSGHINDTYCAEYDQAGHRLRYIHQRINKNIFKNPEALMENIQRVTDHNQAALMREANPERLRRGLTLVPAHTGKPYAIDDQGDYWRTYLFIERARTYDKIESPQQAQAAAAAFGKFQKLAASLQGERLSETIPDFHHTPKRYEAFCAALERDEHNRAKDIKPEIDFLHARQDDFGMVVDQMTAGNIPERVTHNDTKLNNVMIDDFSGEGVCVIDLDTVMPGSVLYDFSDMVRTATNSALEDETDVSKASMQMPMFEALLQGYLSAAAGFLNDYEKEGLGQSAKLMSLECGMRFLTDYLQGDTYFKIKRPAHNLDRARTQFALVKSIEQQQSEIDRLIQRTFIESEFNYS